MPAFPDPYLANRFLIEIDGITRASFQECTGFDSTIEVTEYREGGDPTTSRKLPGNVTYANIQLRWGTSDDTDLYEWHQKATAGRIERKNGSIVLLSGAGEEVARWNFRRAWPTKWTGPSLNAQTNDVAIETLELAHEGLVRG